MVKFEHLPPGFHRYESEETKNLMVFVASGNLISMLHLRESEGDVSMKVV